MKTFSPSIWNPVDIIVDLKYCQKNGISTMVVPGYSRNQLFLGQFRPPLKIRSVTFSVILPANRQRNESMTFAHGAVNYKAFLRWPFLSLHSLSSSICLQVEVMISSMFDFHWSTPSIWMPHTAMRAKCCRFNGPVEQQVELNIFAIKNHNLCQRVETQKSG